MIRLEIEKLKFDEERHLYTYDGMPVPSVTQVIQEWIDVKISGKEWKVNRFNGLVLPKDVMENAAHTGTEIHKGCAFLASGMDLNWDKLDAKLVKPLKNFKDWLDKFSVETVMVEQVFYSHKHGYAGTLDLLVKILGRGYLIDIKTCKPDPMFHIQTAAYDQGINECLLADASAKEKFVAPLEIEMRGILYVPKDGGKVKLIAREHEYWGKDFMAFLHLLKLKQYMEGAE